MINLDILLYSDKKEGKKVIVLYKTKTPPAWKWISGDIPYQGIKLSKYGGKEWEAGEKVNVSYPENF